jgi:hypothetical protein
MGFMGLKAVVLFEQNEQRESTASADPAHAREIHR